MKLENGLHMKKIWKKKGNEKQSKSYIYKCIRMFCIYFCLTYIVMINSSSRFTLFGIIKTFVTLST